MPLIGVGFGEEGWQVVATKDKFAKELGESMRGRLVFVAREKAVAIQARPNGSLPLEFVAGERLEASDRILGVGESFAWPGCGFDRTSYEVKEVGEAFVVIKYSRGIAQQDGYQDSGEFRIDFGSGEMGQPAAEPKRDEKPQPEGQDLPHFLTVRIQQLELMGTREIQKWPENAGELFQGQRKQLASKAHEGGASAEPPAGGDQRHGDEQQQQGKRLQGNRIGPRAKPGWREESKKFSNVLNPDWSSARSRIEGRLKSPTPMTRT